MSTDTLGDRIKRYERVSQHVLQPRTPLFVRIDGRAFHTFTRGAEKPFDRKLIDAMVYAMRRTANDMAGFKLAYHQSDEVTFMLSDYETLQSQGWFGYELNKVVSITASLFTAFFNDAYKHPHGVLATFDARAFSVPIEDAPNVFIWRQRDWERNSLQMLAHAHFSHKALHGKKHTDLHEMLHEKDVNWAHLPDALKNGTFLVRDGSYVYDRMDFEGVQALIDVSVE